MSKLHLAFGQKFARLNFQGRRREPRRGYGCLDGQIEFKGAATGEDYGAIGIALCGTILNDRTNLHFARLTEHLNAGNAAMQEFLRHVSHATASATLSDMSLAQTIATRKLWLLSYREAQVQSFADACLAIGTCLAIATLLVPLLRKVAPANGATVTAH